MRRTRWPVVVAVVACLGLLAATPALGDPKDDKAKVDRELAKSRSLLEGASTKAQQAAAAYTTANTLLPGAQAAVATAQGQVAAAQVVAASTRRAADAAALQLSAAQKQLGAAEAKMQNARKVVGTFVANTYKGLGTAQPLSVFDMRSPSKVATQMAYLDHVSRQQAQALTTATKARQTATEQRNTVKVKKLAADTANTRAQNAVNAAQSAVTTAQNAKTHVQTLIVQRQQALTVANQERSANKVRTDQLKAESDRIAAELRAAAERIRIAQEKAKGGKKDDPGGSSGGSGGSSGGSGGSSGGSGGGSSGGGGSGGGGSSSSGVLDFMKPAKGWKSSDFGNRYDPYFQVWQLHAGTDIAAPGGSDIKAANDGEVVKAGWNGGYGKYTCIYHGTLNDGRTVSTCYAHQSSINVTVGNKVSKGQKIGEVGTTGASTGNHLHFEVRLNGEPVNPLRYLNIS